MTVFIYSPDIISGLKNINLKLPMQVVKQMPGYQWKTKKWGFLKMETELQKLTSKNTFYLDKTAAGIRLDD